MFFEDSRCVFDLHNIKVDHNSFKPFSPQVSLHQVVLEQVNLTASEAYMISRFKSRLQWDIEEKVTLQSFFKLNDVKGKSRTRNFTNMSIFQSNRSRPAHISSVTNNGRSATSTTLRPSGSITSDKILLKGIHICNKEGHKSNVCPKCGAVNFIEAIDEEEIEGVEDQEEIQENVIESKEEEDFGHSLVVWRLMYAPKKEEPPQCHNVFRTKCTIDGKVCDVIIDFDNSENIISSLMV
ncbi:unnamed protein product [Spirodela intermedia]|uniref:Uncharacterized protein n=1 Tax=Spirodela intermedia TaxID=51605 RepID=A0A7I8K6C7_SPIIN|nr:unnamed protein product [Spirodela intermedia]